MKRVLLILTLVLSASLLFAAGQQAAPEGAAPEEVEQVFRAPTLESGTYFDWMKTVYNRVGQPDVIQLPLTYYDKNYDLHYLGAEDMSVSDDGLTWTINLREGLLWSDGEALTASDYVFALTRAVQQGYDFGWYWGWAAGIKNWGAVESGDVPLSEFGVQVVDDTTIQVEIDSPKPYFPGIVSVWFPVPEHAVEEHGDEYATRAETMVSSGPFMLTEWVRGNQMVLERNPNYNGPWQPTLDRVILYPTLNSAEVGFPAYLAGELDTTTLNAGQLALAQRQYEDQIQTNAAFVVFYLSYDYETPPFNDPDVRRALLYSINREEVTSTLLKDLAVPAETLLAPGFPGYNQDIADQVVFDPERAQDYLAEAGYPGGEGFPTVTFYWREEGGATQVVKPLAEYLQAQWQEILGINVELGSGDVATWMDALMNTRYKMFLSPYAHDYVDPSNFFNIFVNPGSRHNWTNEEYNALVREANRTQTWEDRLELYDQAEQILVVDEAAIAPLIHPLQHSLMKPYVVGEGAEPNDFGYYAGAQLYRWTHIEIAE